MQPIKMIRDNYLLHFSNQLWWHREAKSLAPAGVERLFFYNGHEDFCRLQRYGEEVKCCTTPGIGPGAERIINKL